MFFSTLNEMETFFRKTPRFSFFGLGAVGANMLAFLETFGLADHLQTFILSSREGFPSFFCGKPVHCIGELAENEKNVPVFIATQEKLHDEIGRVLMGHGVPECFSASDEALYAAGEKMREKICEDVDEELAVREISTLQNASVEKADILFLSPPYWDIYSPFSAIPSLVGKLRTNGISAAQADIGIECFHYLLQHAWKPVAISFMIYSFYKNEVCKYKDNPYQTYEEYCDGLWFFQGDCFPIEDVKNSYATLNGVQCGVISCFYQKILALDATPINFNTLRSICGLLEVTPWRVLYATLLSERIKPIWRGLPRVIGISATGTGQFLPACKIASLLKKVKPDVKLILGGSSADLFMESIYPFKHEIYDYFDYVVVGEGETAIWQLCDCLKNGNAGIENIPNLAHINEANEVSYAAQILENVEKLPLADYTGLDLDRYMAPRTILPYQASRGCHYGHCAFCNHNEKYRHNYRMKSKEKVVDELVQLATKYGVRDIQFVDEAIRPDHFAGIVEEMERKESFRGIEWFYYSRVSRQYTKDLLQRAYRCGCRMVMFGIETLNQRLLQFIKKGIHTDTSKFCLALFHGNKIKTYAWLMGNLPSETLEELRADIAAVEENILNIDAAAVGAFCLEINTDMYHAPLDYNILTVDFTRPEMFSSSYQGVLIDKEKILDCLWREYIPMLRHHFFFRDRYETYFGGGVCGGEQEG